MNMTTTTITRWAFAALTVMGASGVPASAQSGRVSLTGDVTRPYLDAEQGMTVDTLVALALDRAPAILAVRARAAAAHADVDQAALRPNPSISVKRRDDTGSPDGEFGIDLSVPLDLFRREGRVGVASQAAAGADAAVNDAERRLRIGVRKQAALALGAVANALGQTRDLIAARVVEGAAPSLERDLAEVEYQRADVVRRQRRADADAAIVALRAMVGLAPGTPLRFKLDLEALVAESSALALPADVDAAIANRPDVRRADAAIRAAIARRDLLLREARPDVSLFGGYTRVRMGFPQLGFTAAGDLTPVHGATNNVEFGAMVMLPARNRNQGAVAAADADAQAAGQDRADLVLQARADVDAAGIRDAEARAVVATYRGGLGALAERNLEVVRETYQLGRATLFDVIGEIRRYLDFQRDYTAALVAAFDARADLAGALGDVR